jgi:signal transduction histidine kinase
MPVSASSSDQVILTGASIRPDPYEPSTRGDGDGTKGPRPPSADHLVRFYEDDDLLSEAVASFLGEGIRAGDALVVIATPSHWGAFRRQLDSSGFDIESVAESGRLTVLDAQETLSMFLRNGEPNRELFELSVGKLISDRIAALSNGARLRAYGEMVDLLWRDRQRHAAIALEELWNGLQGRHSFTLLCAYAMANFLKEPAELQRVCATHSHVVSDGVGAGARLADAKPTALPPQYARQLATEIARREEIENTLRASLRDLRAKERSRAAASTRAERLFKITAAIADAVSPAQVFEALVDRVAEAIEASSVALWLVDDQHRHAKLARARGYSEAAMQALEVLPLDIRPSIPAIDAIHRGSPIWIPSQAALLEQYPHLRSVATPGRCYRASCLPLMAHGYVLGSLAVTIEEASEPAEEERGFLLLVARYASQAIERLRLLEAERRSRSEAAAAANRLDALSRASQAFTESDLDLQSRLRAVASELATTFGGCINIGLLEPDGFLYLTAVQHPIAEAQTILQDLAAKSPIRVGEGATGSIAATGKSIFLPTIDPEASAASAAPEYRAFLDRYPVYALIGAPLRGRGRVIGTVTATRVRVGETYTLEDLRLLEELAERAAGAIDNSRLYQETHEARSRAEQLYRFAQAVAAADRIETVFDAAMDAIERALGATRMAVLTFDADRVMRFRAWRNLSDGYRHTVEGHSPWPADAIAPAPVLVPDAERDPAMASYHALFRSEGIGALAFIPLVTRGRLLGKFMIYYARPHPFAPQEVETTRAIGNHLASVITRFEVIQKLEETIRYNELFAGVLAHDLRNPLTAMMTMAQILLVKKEGGDPEGARQSKSLGRILASGRRMETMIAQLLDFTRIRSGGGIAIEPDAANLSDLCAQTVGELEAARPEWNIRCEVFGDQRGTWDSDRLLQVLSNLVANAGQHGNSGAPVSVKLDGTDPASVKFEIHNEGVIPPSLLPHLFDPFIGTRQSSRSGGLGLGLFIVREIVHAHGGTIEVSSTEADGTTFLVRLPRRSEPLGKRPDFLT